MGKGVMKAVENVNNAIRAYQAERQRLDDQAKLPGVKGIGAKQQLNVGLLSFVLSPLLIDDVSNRC